MDDDEERQGEPRSWEGCHGERIAYAELDMFLEDAFAMDDVAETNEHERYATCVWGHSGVGKSAKIRQLKNKPVTWQGKQYPGYRICDVPVAQWEEMGDVHGMPEKHVLMRNGTEHWIPMAVVDAYRQEGWTIIPEAGVRTMYAPPDWVPREPGPTIFHLEDWNRPSQRIIKGIMQLLQTYGLMSWKLPPGSHIVCTGNPDDQQYLVTSIDPAILTRIRHATLEEDAVEWGVWAEQQGLDSRGINFVLRYPEMMVGPEKTNPRTLTEVCRFLSLVPNLGAKRDMRRFEMFSKSLLDAQTVTTLTVFLDREVELIVAPQDVLRGDKKAFQHVAGLMGRKEKRVDVVSVTLDRLYTFIANPKVLPDPKSVANIQDFILMSELEPDMVHNFCLRIGRTRDRNRDDWGRMQKWVLGNAKVQQLLREVS